MNVVSLFAGVGGLDRAFERAGCNIVLQSEIDPKCQQVLRHHWPDVPLVADVADVASDVTDQQFWSDIEIIVGGFPCTDVSTAGKRAGLAGEKSKLYWEFHRVLDVVRPRYFLLENVRGLLSSNQGRDLGTILGSLVDLGYGISYRVLDAQFFGVPQRRQRIFIVGCLGDAPGAAQILLEPEGGNWNPPTREQQGTSTSGSAGEGASGDRQLLADTGVVSALAARMGTSGHGDLANAFDWQVAGSDRTWIHDKPDGPCRSLTSHKTMAVHGFRKSQRAHNPDDGETWVDDGIANTLDAEGNGTRTAHAIVTPYSITPASGQGADLNAIEVDTSTALSATDGKMHDRGVRVASELGVRRLLPIECARLQGFPDDWLDVPGIADTHKYRMLGNAVPVPVVEWIAKRMVAHAMTGNAYYMMERDGENVTLTAVETMEEIHSSGEQPATIKARPHCAKFSDALLPEAVDMLRSHGLVENDMILDPFAGVGKGVEYLRGEGFDALGIELEPEWASQSEYVLQGDALALPWADDFLDAVFTSCTFGNRMADRDLRESVAGTYAKSLGRHASEGSSCHMQWGPAYKEFHTKAWIEARRVLCKPDPAIPDWIEVEPTQPGGLFLLNIKDHVRGKQLQHVPEWHEECLNSLGFETIEKRFIKTPGNRRGTNKDSALEGEWLILFRLTRRAERADDSRASE